MIILNDIEFDRDGQKTIVNQKLYRENIYAGAVVSKNGPYIVPERKILFTKRHYNAGGSQYEYVEDLLYDTPNYRFPKTLDDIKNGEFCVDCIVKLETLLEKFGFKDTIVYSDIRKIYNLCLNPNSELFNKEYESLPIEWIDYLLLDRIAQYKKQPSKYEKNEYPDKFKTKVKTYTFR